MVERDLGRRLSELLVVLAWAGSVGAIGAELQFQPFSYLAWFSVTIGLARWLLTGDRPHARAR